MATFIPATGFVGYPDGKTPVRFQAGVESPEVPAAFAKLMAEKGLVWTDSPAPTRAPAAMKKPSRRLSRKLAASKAIPGKK